MSEEEIIIPLSKTKIVFITVGSILFVALGFWILSIVDEQNQNTAVFEKSIGIVSIGFFGICTIYGFLKLFDNKPGLVIRSDGFIDNSSAIAGETIISWHMVTEIGTTKYNFKDLLRLCYRIHMK